MRPSESLLEVEQIASGYGTTTILHGASLKVLPGEIVSIIGPNGAGKTTLLNTISGLCRVRSGHVRFAGADVTRWRADRIVNAGVVQCPEGRRIFLRMTVEENLIAGYAMHRGKSFAELRDYAYTLFPTLSKRRHETASRLSGGQQQMLAVARALMAQPKLLMLDEPSLGLAPKVVNQIFSLILDLAAHSMTILLVEQNVGLALEISDYAYALQSGRCVLEGPSAKMLADSRIRQFYLAA